MKPQQTKSVYTVETTNANHRKQKVRTQLHTSLTKGVECLTPPAPVSHSCLCSSSLCPHSPHLPLKHQQLPFAGWPFLGLDAGLVLEQTLCWRRSQSRATFPPPIPWVLLTELSLKSLRSWSDVDLGNALFVMLLRKTSANGWNGC